MYSLTNWITKKWTDWLVANWLGFTDSDWLTVVPPYLLTDWVADWLTCLQTFWLIGSVIQFNSLSELVAN